MTTGLLQRATTSRAMGEIFKSPRGLKAANQGPMRVSWSRLRTATIATITISSGQRVLSTSSLRMLTTVSKPIRGSSTAKARREVAAVWRNELWKREAIGDVFAPISHLLDLGPA